MLYFVWKIFLMIFNSNITLTLLHLLNSISIEVCELVGVYILHLLRTVMRKENVGLYRDDGLGKLQNSLGPEIE